MVELAQVGNISNAIIAKVKCLDRGQLKRVNDINYIYVFIYN